MAGPAAKETRPLLRVDKLRVEFATRGGVLRAVDDISFEIEEGEVLGVSHQPLGSGHSLGLAAPLVGIGAVGLFKVVGGGAK